VGAGEVGFTGSAARLVILYILRDDFQPLDPRELTTMMNRT
jgi:hypothetical protein